MSDASKPNTSKSVQAFFDEPVVSNGLSELARITGAPMGESIINVAEFVIDDANFNKTKIANNIINTNEEIRRHTSSAVMKAVAIGIQLKFVKSRLHHGDFHSWMETTLAPRGLKTRTAQRYMKLAEDFDQILEKISRSHFKKTGETLTIADAQSMAMQMSLRSAASLLSPPTATEEDNNEDDAVTNNVVEGAAQFFDCSLKSIKYRRTKAKASRVSCLVPANEKASQNNCFRMKMLLFPTHQRHNQTIVQDAIEHWLTHKESSQLLFLNDQESYAWLPKLDPFARIEIRVSNARGKDRIRRLFLITRADLIAPFASAFDELGPVFVPFTLHNSSEAE
ncbi:MAG: DUF3102 domain-containing protein [Phycisphaera sp. RhM]|nr:DUF3102 domain-containing protein [Phycisphaera sp. RhM]